VDSTRVNYSDLVKCNQDLELGMSKKSEELKELQEKMIGLTSEFEKEQNETRRRSRSCRSS
jgi:hypothetical protein